MKNSSPLIMLLVGCAVAASSTLIGVKPSKALDYAKCDAMGKRYAELKASRDAAMESVPGWVDETQDPRGYAKWRKAVIAVGEPYDATMLSIRNDAISEGCIKQ
tara:strand:+ start:128 stop:439 length:312 start_codon:yes stop_codon:yes gene_type:complete